MATYFRIKEITAPATVLRQGNLLGIELGDFIYPEEVDTIVCANTIIYSNENTCENFVWQPQDAAVVKASKVVAAAPVAPVETPAEVVPAPLETGSEDTKA